MSARVVGLLLASTLLAACNDPCSPGSEPSLTIGTGDAAYEPLGETIDFVRGPQGGYHLLIGMLVTHMRGSEFMGGEVSGAIEGTVRAEERPWLDFTCSNEHDGLITSGHFLIYDAWPEDQDPDEIPDLLHEASTTITVTVRDVDGTSVTASATTTILDPCITEPSACD